MVVTSLILIRLGLLVLFMALLYLFLELECKLVWEGIAHVLFPMPLLILQARLANNLATAVAMFNHANVRAIVPLTTAVTALTAEAFVVHVVIIRQVW